MPDQIPDRCVPLQTLVSQATAEWNGLKDGLQEALADAGKNPSARSRVINRVNAAEMKVKTAEDNLKKCIANPPLPLTPVTVHNIDPVTVQLPAHLPVFVANANFNVFADHSDANTFWYLPAYQFQPPQSAFFSVISNNSVDTKNKELFTCVLNINFSDVITPDRQQYFNSLPNSTLNKIPVTLNSVIFKIYYENHTKSIPITGKINDNGNVSFEFKDTEDFSAVQLAYRNIANPDNNPGEYAEIIFSGTFSALTRVSGIVANNNNYIQQNVAYPSDPIKISVPCNTLNGTLYTHEKNNTTTSFGCLPPWSAQAASGSLFKEVMTDFVEASIFQSYIQPEFFYLIPTNYYIARDDANNYAPSVNVIAMLDPDDDPQHKTKSIIVLNFFIKPAMTSYDMENLKQKLLSFCPAIAGVKIFPLVKFPSISNAALSPGNLIDAKGDGGSLYNATEEGYNLRFTVSNPTDMLKAEGLIPTMLKSPSGCSQKITFSLDDKTQPASTILLSFNSTTGNMLDCSFDKASRKITITNKSPLTINIGNLLFYTKGAAGSQDCSLAQPLTLSATQQAIIPFEQLSLADTSVLNTFNNLEVNYTIEENVNDNLTESRICTNFLSTVITVTTNINPTLNNIQKIVVNAQILIVNINELLLTLMPNNGAFTGNPDFNITLPLNDELAKPENQVMAYTVEFYFNDNTSKKTESKQINFGTSPIIYIAPTDIPI